MNRNVVINTISIKDDGKGTPRNILEKLGQQRVTQGKDGSLSGSGLGVYHARKNIDRFGGQFQISSEEGLGTEVNLILPKANTPQWFVERIILVSNQTVVSIDDDPSVHLVWECRLRAAGAVTGGIKYLNFPSPEQAEDWLKNNRLTPCLFLVDYEFFGRNTNGLDFIQRAGLSGNSLLITAQFDSDKIRSRARIIGVKILPKILASLVPIEIKHTID